MCANFLKTLKYIKGEHFVSLSKSLEKAMISASLNIIIFQEKKTSVMKSPYNKITGKHLGSLPQKIFKTWLLCPCIFLNLFFGHPQRYLACS